MRIVVQNGLARLDTEQQRRVRTLLHELVISGFFGAVKTAIDENALTHWHNADMNQLPAKQIEFQVAHEAVAAIAELAREPGQLIRTIQP